MGKGQEERRRGFGWREQAGCGRTAPNRDRLAVAWSRRPPHPEPAMSIARTVAEVLAQHVTLTIEGLDRLYLNVYVPPLQREGGVVAFFRRHRGQPFASSALMEPISAAFVAA